MRLKPGSQRSTTARQPARASSWHSMPIEPSVTRWISSIRRQLQPPGDPVLGAAPADHPRHLLPQPRAAELESSSSSGRTVGTR